MNGKTLTKKMVVSAVAKATGISLNQCHKLMASTLRNTLDNLRQGKSVELKGLATFFVHHKSGRFGQNPKNGTVHNVTPRSVVIGRFKKK